MQASQWFHSLLFSLWIHCINYCKTAQKSILITKRIEDIIFVGHLWPYGATCSVQMRACYLK
jgi:hypothetical protein